MRISDWSSDVCSSDLQNLLQAALQSPDSPGHCCRIGTKCGRCSPDLSRACDGQEKTQIIPVHTPASLHSHPAKSQHCNAAVIACMRVPTLQLKNDRSVTSNISSQETPSAAGASSATVSIRTIVRFMVRRGLETRL